MANKQGRKQLNSIRLAKVVINGVDRNLWPFSVSTKASIGKSNIKTLAQVLHNYNGTTPSIGDGKVVVQRTTELLLNDKSDKGAIISFNLSKAEYRLLRKYLREMDVERRLLK